MDNLKRDNLVIINYYKFNSFITLNVKGEIKIGKVTLIIDL